MGVFAQKVIPGSPVKIELSSGETLEVDACLVATGRVPVTRELGLDALGIDIGRRGFVPVNDRMETELPHLWAIGDATGLNSYQDRSQVWAFLGDTQSIHETFRMLLGVDPNPSVSI